MFAEHDQQVTDTDIRLKRKIIKEKGRRNERKQRKNTALVQYTVVLIYINLTDYMQKIRLYKYISVEHFEKLSKFN